MARGLVAGGIFFSALALVCGLLAQFGGREMQAWFVERTEMFDEICSRGTGLYYVNSMWGEDIQGLIHHRRRHCVNDDRNRKELSTSEAYCRSSAHPTDFERDMCVRTIIAKSLALLSMLFHVGAIGAGLFCHSVDSVSDEILPASMAAAFAFLASLSSWGLFFVMSSSKLFSQGHIAAIAKQNRLLVPYSGVGCVFQEPFKSPLWPLTMLQNWPQECVLFGYGYVLSICQASFALLSSLILVVLVKDLKNLHRVQLLQRNGFLNMDTQGLEHHQMLQGDGLEREGFEDGSQGNGERQQEADRAVERFDEEENDEGESAKWNRYYSLYGAFHRHLGLEYGWLSRRVIATTVPLAVLGSIAMNVIWMLHGVRFTLTVDTKTPVFELAFGYEVFDFNSVTSVTDFWRGNARLMAGLTLLATFVVPIVKCVLWLYFWYLPCDEILRGQVLFWIDALGKVALANIFSLVLMAVAFLFDSHLHIPLYFFPVDVQVGVGLNNGFRGVPVLLLVSAISLVLGHWFVYFHGLAARWEQIRHKGLQAKLRRTPSLFQIMDTPFALDADAHHSPNSYHVASPFFSLSHQGQIEPPSEDFSLDGGVRRAISAETLSSQATPPPRHSLRATVFLLPLGEKESQREPRESLLPSVEPMLSDFQEYKFSRVAKVVFDILLVSGLVLTLCALLMLPIFRFRRAGVVGELVLSKEQQVLECTLLFFVKEIYSLGLGGSLVWLSAVLVVFLIVFPALQLFGLLVLWLVPLRRLRTQVFFFRLVEMFAAWNSIDIFLVCLAVTYSDIGMVGDTLIPQVVPAMVSGVHRVFPDQSLYKAEAVFESGFWVLLAGTLAEKLCTTTLMPLFATRIAQQKLASIRMRMDPGQGYSSRHEHHGAMEILSPSARYVSNPSAAGTGVIPSILWNFVTLSGILVPT